MPIFEILPFYFAYDSIKMPLGVIFSNPQKMSAKKACLRVNLRANSREFSFRGVYPGDAKLHLGYVLKTSDHACVQHLYSSGL